MLFVTDNERPVIVQVADVIGDLASENLAVDHDETATQRPSRDALRVLDGRGKLFVCSTVESQDSFIEEALKMYPDSTLVTARLDHWIAARKGRGVPYGVTLHFDEMSGMAVLDRKSVLIIEDAHLLASQPKDSLRILYEKQGPQTRTLMFTTAPVVDVFEGPDTETPSRSVSILYGALKRFASQSDEAYIDASRCLAKAALNGDAPAIAAWWTGYVFYEGVAKSLPVLVQRRYLGKMTEEEHRVFEQLEIVKLGDCDLTLTRQDNNCGTKIQFVAQQASKYEREREVSVILSDFEESLKQLLRHPECPTSVKVMSSDVLLGGREQARTLFKDAKHVFILEPPRQWSILTELLSLVGEMSTGTITVHRLCWTRPDRAKSLPTADVCFRDMLFAHEFALETMYKGLFDASENRSMEALKDLEIPRWHSFRDIAHPFLPTSFNDSGTYERPTLASTYEHKGFVKVDVPSEEFRVEQTRKFASRKEVIHFKMNCVDWSDTQKSAFKEILARLDPLLPNYEDLYRSIFDKIAKKEIRETKEIKDIKEFKSSME